VLTESAARWILVLHTIVGVAAVGAATHLVVYLRRYLRGQSGRRRTVLRFAWLVLALQIGAFTAGNVMYPTYKVQVRAAYLENASAITAAEQAKQREVVRLAEREHTAPSEPTATVEIVKRAAQAARWFDVKEHWVAIGLLASLALVLVLAFWDPQRDGPALSPVVVGLSLVIAGTVWLAAIVGVLTSAWRAV
jgi:hypothetical protein